MDIFFFFDLLRILDCDGYLLLGIFFFLVIGFDQSKMQVSICIGIRNTYTSS